MALEGHIENGVVVFDQPVSLPNGTPVRVEVVVPEKTLAERFTNVIGAGIDLPEDIAKDHDHHLNDRIVLRRGAGRGGGGVEELNAVLALLGNGENG
jgi:hypothetical protein